MKNNRFLLNVLMDAAIVAISDTISYRHRGGGLTAGVIVVLHPFSKKMGFNPHLHLLVTEGGFDKQDNFTGSVVFCGRYRYLHMCGAAGTALRLCAFALNQRNAKTPRREGAKDE